MTAQDRKEVKDLANKHINGITLKILIPVIGCIVGTTWYLSALYTTKMGEFISSVQTSHAVDSAQKVIYAWQQEVSNVELPEMKNQLATLSATVKQHDVLINYMDGKPQPKNRSYLVTK